MNDLKLRFDLYVRGLSNSGWDDILERGMESVKVIGEAVEKPGVGTVTRAAMAVARTLSSSDLYYAEVLDVRTWKPMFPTCIKNQLLEILEPMVTSRIRVNRSGGTNAYLITKPGIQIAWVKDGDEGGAATEILAHVDNHASSVEYARELLWKTIDPTRIVLSSASSGGNKGGGRRHHGRGEHGQLRVSTDDLVVPASSEFSTEYAPYLQKCIEQNVNRTILFYGPPGCHAKGQLIMMSDGTFKKVEDIIVGDTLMGPSGDLRNVEELRRGRDEMVRIIPNKGQSFVVNKDHILTLVRNNWKLNKKNKSVVHYELIDVTVKEWFTWSAGRKSAHKLVRDGVVTFQEPAQKLRIDPYILGVLIGDGSTMNGIRICSMDNEILSACEDFASKNNIGFNEVKSVKNGKARTFGLTVGRGQSNSVFTSLKEMGLNVGSGDKFVPHEYKTTSVDNRRHILAGLIDTDGHLDSSGCFDYCSKSIRLAEDVAFVARSLGLAAYVSSCRKRATNSKSKDFGTYYRVCISGDLSIVPTRLLRKKANVRKQIKNVRFVGFKVEDVGVDDFYGFTLDKDGRYLLNDFTITHNTGKSTISRTLCDILKLRSLRVRVEDLSDLGSEPIVEMIKIFDPDVVIFDDLDRAVSQVALLETLETLHKRVRFVFATVNHIENLQQALIRPGRFDELVEIVKLDAAAVHAMLGEYDDAFEVVKNWPVAFVNEYVIRRRLLGPEKALAALDDLQKRVVRLMGKDPDEEEEDDE